MFHPSLCFPSDWEELCYFPDLQFRTYNNKKICNEMLHFQRFFMILPPSWLQTSGIWASVNQIYNLLSSFWSRLSIRKFLWQGSHFRLGISLSFALGINLAVIKLIAWSQNARWLESMGCRIMKSAVLHKTWIILLC